MTRCIAMFIAGVFVVPAGLLLYAWWALRGPRDVITLADLE